MECAWRDRGVPEDTSVRIASIPAEIRTDYLPSRGIRVLLLDQLVRLLWLVNNTDKIINTKIKFVFGMTGLQLGDSGRSLCNKI